LVLPGRRGIRARHQQNRGFQYRRPVQAATCFWIESGEIGSSLLTEGSIRLSWRRTSSITHLGQPWYRRTLAPCRGHTCSNGAVSVWFWSGSSVSIVAFPPRTLDSSEPSAVTPVLQWTFSSGWLVASTTWIWRGGRISLRARGRQELGRNGRRLYPRTSSRCGC